MSNDQMIESVIAQIRNFSPAKPIKDAVLYFWESHTENRDDKKRIQATVDLIYKEFYIPTCEKYEVRTGYLNRYNHLLKPITDASEEEIKEAIAKGIAAQKKWVELTEPDMMPDFIKENWEDYFSEEENPFWESCKELVLEKIGSDEDFSNAFAESVNEFATKHGTDVRNGHFYILEETSWMLTLPLLHLNKQIYLIHVGGTNSAVNAMFHHFPNLQKAVKWISPRFSTSVFKNNYDFLLDYRNGSHMGYSYAIENKNVVKPVTQFKKSASITKEELLNIIDHINLEKSLLYSIVGRLPGHVYWLSRNNVYLGCNDLQAERLGLKSRSDIIGKTNYDLHRKKEAEEINKINTKVMETGKLYEGQEFSSSNGNGSRKYLSQKTPLFNNDGKIVGLLGISIDVTDRERAKELEFALREQKNFKNFAEQIAHDIRSPLAALSMLTRSCKGLSEKEHIALRNIVTSIENITGNLLNNYKEDKRSESIDSRLSERYVSIHFALLEMVNTKKHQYRDSNVTFNYSCDPLHKLIFIGGDYSDFCRMISNLLNNSVEAFEGKAGIIDVWFSTKSRKVEVHIGDNGKGWKRYAPRNGR